MNNKNLFWFNTVTLVLICSLFITGCWDQKELQDRAFIMTVGIDVADEGLGATGSPPYEVSVQVLKLAAGASEKQSAQEAKTYVLSGRGESIFEIIRQLYSNSSKALWFEHLQAIIISRKAIEKKGLKPVLDFFIRDSETRWKIKLFTTQNKVRQFLEYQPPTGEAGGIFLDELIDQYTRNPEIAGRLLDLGYINLLLDTKKEVFMPQISMQKKKIQITGADVYRGNTYLGHYDEYSIKGQKFIIGGVESAIIAVPYPPGTDTIMALEIFKIVSKLEPHVNEDEIYFTLDIFIRGNVGEKQITREVIDLDDSKQIIAFEEAINNEIKTNIMYGLNQSRRIGADFLQFSDKLRAHYPETWARLKEKWSNIYPTIPLYVRVESHVRHRGEHL